MTLTQTITELSHETNPTAIRNILQDFARRVIHTQRRQRETYPQDLQIHPGDRPRVKRSTTKILAMLRRRPRTNAELATISSRYGARIHDIRRAGYIIESTRIGGSRWLYTLRGDK